MRVIVEFELKDREEYNELYSEISNFDGYIKSYIKQRVSKDTHKLKVIEGSGNKKKRIKNE